MNYLKTPIFRSETLRRAVAELECVNCGREQNTQAAHGNQGKGMGLKVSDAKIAALCADLCHPMLDQSGSMTKAERREFEVLMIARTLVRLIERGVLRFDAGKLNEEPETIMTVLVGLVESGALVVDTKRFREGRQ